MADFSFGGEDGKMSQEDWERIKVTPSMNFTCVCCQGKSWWKYSHWSDERSGFPIMYSEPIDHSKI
jgi:hypothetical protein